ncbi:MAG: stage III sporulation protein AG [Lachnospiraceae bacterium]|nr:stage III sporulation protein AG [Lachnospiraceae bacterium]
MQSAQTAENAGLTGGTSEQEEYCAQLEARLEEILSGMDGVGKVRVMVTLASSEELVLEKDTPSSRSQTNETDSSGGTRIINQMENDEETVYITEGSDSTPYVVKTLVPKVEGVVVVAEGSGSGSVNKDITDIAQALFGIEAHKVKVVKMEEAK